MPISWKTNSCKNTGLFVKNPLAKVFYRIALSFYGQNNQLYPEKRRPSQHSVRIVVFCKITVAVPERMCYNHAVNPRNTLFTRFYDPKKL